MTTSLQPLTAEDLARMPKDGFRYELVLGELRKMSPSGYTHGRTTTQFTWRLAQYVEAHHLGVVTAAKTGFLLSTHPDTVRAPDLALIRQHRVEAAGEVEGFWVGAPDLAVEVLSPSDTRVDVEEKVGDWLKAGARMVVVVDPRQQVATVYRSRTDVTLLGPDDVLDGGDVVPGWTLPLRQLFT